MAKMTQIFMVDAERKVIKESALIIMNLRLRLSVPILRTKMILL